VKTPLKLDNELVLNPVDSFRIRTVASLIGSELYLKHRGLSEFGKICSANKTVSTIVNKIGGVVS
jgi:hypothetical protein